MFPDKVLLQKLRRSQMWMGVEVPTFSDQAGETVLQLGK